MIFRYQCSAQQGLNWRKEWMAFFGDYLFLIICNNSFKVSNSSFSAKLTYSSDVIFSNYNNRKHFSLAVYLQPHSIKLIKKLDPPVCGLERHKITCKSLACAQALMTRVSRLREDWRRVKENFAGSLELINARLLADLFSARVAQGFILSRKWRNALTEETIMRSARWLTKRDSVRYHSSWWRAWPGELWSVTLQTIIIACTFSILLLKSRV